MDPEGSQTRVSVRVYRIDKQKDNYFEEDSARSVSLSVSPHVQSLLMRGVTKNKTIPLLATLGRVDACHGRGYQVLQLLKFLSRMMWVSLEAFSSASPPPQKRLRY